MIFDTIYNKGYEAGLNAARLENQEAQNRRLEEMFKYGKEAGRGEGWKDGYTKGYECGYSEGEILLAAEKGIPAVELGPRILRCETASGFVLSSLTFAFEL